MSAPTWLRSDPSLKIASAILAVFVWMYVRTEEKPVQVFSVPLEMEGVPRDLALAGEPPDSLAVRVRAPDSTLRNLTPGRFHAHVSLGDARPGELTVPLTTQNVRAPVGVEVLGVEPQSLSLRLERRISRQVPVVARFKGLPAAGFEQDGHTLTPDSVTVEGPEGIVRQVREAVTEEVNLTGRSRSFETVVSVAPDRGGARVTSETGASLRVNIREQRVTRSYPGVRVTSSLPDGVTYRVESTPETVTVVLEGTKAALDSLGPSNIHALLDLEGMSPRKAPYSVKPRIAFDPGDLASRVAVHSVSDLTINVKISR